MVTCTSLKPCTNETSPTIRRNNSSLIRGMVSTVNLSHFCNDVSDIFTLFSCVSHGSTGEQWDNAPVGSMGNGNFKPFPVPR
jgi:hypothetical protein